MPILNNINWQIESIRVTAFVHDPFNPNMLEAWLGNVTENLPTQVSKTPSSFAGVSRSTAGFLRVNWSADRLDVLLSSEELQDREAIAPMSDATPLFDRFVRRVSEIGELPLIDRIAFGLVLNFQVPTESVGLESLSPHIVGLNLPRSARDFLYRVNHPYASQSINDVSLNRLATWSVGQSQVIHFQLNPDGSQTQQVVSQGPWAVRLDLDINTDKADVLRADLVVLRNLLNELTTIAVNIALGGEASMRE